jgi:hypothetical protein
MGKVPTMFFRKFLKKLGYVNTSDMEDYLVKIKENERKRTTEELNMKFQEDKNRMREEHFLEIEEKNAEIRHLENIINDKNLYVKDAERVYLASMRGMKTNLRISAEIGYQVKKLMETSATVYAAFENIQQQAEGHKRDMIGNEKEYRSLLRME